MSDLYMSLDIDKLKSTEKIARECAEATYGTEDEENKNKLLYESVRWNIPSSEIDFNDGILNVSGETELGYISANIDLSMDDIIDIIEYYISKVNKMKAVLEATK